MGSSIRVYSWLLLAGLVSATLGQNYNGQYIPPSRCLPAATRYSEVVNFVTRTVTVAVDRPTTIVKYTTQTLVRYSPSVVYRTVTSTEYRQVTSVRQQVVTNTQVKQVVETQVLPDTAVTKFVTVRQPSTIYRDVVSTKFVTQNVVNTRTETVTKIKTLQITYSQPQAVTKTNYITVRTTQTQQVVKTEYNTIVSTVYEPAATNTVYKVNTQTVETTRTQLIPGTTSVVTKTEYVHEQKIIYKTETVPYYATSTNVQIKQELVTVNNVVQKTVPSTQVSFSTVYQQQVKQSVVQVAIKSTSYQERVVTSVVSLPGATRTEYRESTVYRTVTGPQVVKTNVQVSTVFQNRVITITTTSTQLKERLSTKYVKDCGGYKYKQPSVGLNYYGHSG